MKLLLLLLVLAGGWYVHSNGLVPDLGEEWSRLTGVGRRSAPRPSGAHELARIHRMEADLDAQHRYLDARAARLRELAAARRHRAIPAQASADGEEYAREVAALNEGAARFRMLYGTYREDVERYNVRARREGFALHRPLQFGTDEQAVRRRPLSVGVGG